jgi:ABC-type transport system involved in cytochrome c biogenesis permease subunit
MVWAPLALVGPSLLDGVLTLRLVVLALAYVPGRVVGLAATLETVTLGIRTFAAPALVLAVIVTVVRWALRGERPILVPADRPDSRR